ncbi:TonB-dependent receptor domain-containing protein [Pseudoalteromonas denitrificans]|uniref:Outer membrane receptor proteins, mostly Fe transport n=1 Tax=Pseudoalteromonas denitrificans DSM 6059 TaxID=1123010 RepID=A0A1I1GBR3_9GAMM|nr:TonB-dependent receptor [Pseudoalteromonas denitrificans]SFC09001.1 Outer membrane receptor proteins, mostly Fe transport [Pseudoalteromonas denitrificans DSM 6059]
MIFKGSPFVKTSFISLLTLSPLPSISAPSQEPQSSSHYPASFFSQYHPQNAYDMVDRLPGFSFDGGSDERGFGGNAGNVLIDGTRPTSKSGGLKGALIRIPAEQVEKIEILRGGKGSSETAGQSIIANIIRKSNITTGTWALKLRRAPDNDLRPNIEAAFTTQLDGWNTAFDTDIGGWVGYRTAKVTNKNSENMPTQSANEILDEKNNWLYINGLGEKNYRTGKLTINGRIGGDKWQGDTTRDIYQVSASTSQPDKFWQLNEDEIENEFEFGIDWLSITDNWKWHFLSLAVINDETYETHFYSQDFVTANIYDEQFKQDRFKTEYIIRNTYGNVGSDKFKPEYGFEFANNKLDTQLENFENNVEVVLDTANVIVEEFRGEAFITFVYTKTDKLSFEGGLTAEMSQIKVSGDAKNKQTFKFLKPRLSANYNITPSTQLNFLAEHTVGQLNFNDFAASNQAADDRSTAGNPNLVPDQTTELSTTLDWRFSERGSLKVKTFYRWHKDILENIILPSDNNVQSHGLGNAGDATFWGFESNINLPLDKILNNGLLDISYQYNRSKFYDDIIQADRKVDDYTPKALSFLLRQDLVQYNFSWGVEYSGHYTDTSYLVDEIQTFSGNNRLLFFVETTYFTGLKTQLEIEHFNTGEYTRSRYFYENDRSGNFNGSKIAKRKRKPEIKLSVWGTF